jgi:hypothetical protein
VLGEAYGGTCIGLRGSWTVVSLQKGRVSRLNSDGGLMFGGWQVRWMVEAFLRRCGLLFEADVQACSLLEHCGGVSCLR